MTSNNEKIKISSNESINETLNEQLLKKQCNICFCEIEKGENISIPPCDCKDILYHMECYYKWLQQNPTCPHCRCEINIMNHEDEDDEDDEENDNGNDILNENSIIDENNEYEYDSENGIITRTQIIRINESSNTLNHISPLGQRRRLQNRANRLNQSVDAGNNCRNCVNWSIFFTFIFWILYPITISN